jgi:hypothetical protein
MSFKGFKPNSLLFTTHPCGKQPYAQCDPRKEANGPASLAGGGGLSSGVGGTAEGEVGLKDTTANSSDGNSGADACNCSLVVTFGGPDGSPQDPSVAFLAAAAAGSFAADISGIIPWYFKRPMSFRGKQRMKPFDYTVANV